MQFCELLPRLCAVCCSIQLCFNMRSVNSYVIKRPSFCALPDLLNKQGGFYLPPCQWNLTAFSAPQQREQVYGFLVRSQMEECYTAKHLGVIDNTHALDNFLRSSSCLFFPHLNIEIIEDHSLENVPNLTYVSFRYNDIRLVKPLAFANSSKLISLDLGDNRLSKLPQGLFRSLVNLRTLQLSNNQFVRISATTFRPLRSLRTLYLANNSLQGDLQSAPFQNLINLIDLSLKDNLISKLPKTSFEGLTKLRKLNLRHNQLNVVNTSCFLNLRELRQLDLGNNHLLQLAPMHQFPPTGLMNNLKLDGTPLLVYDRAWLGNVPTESIILVSRREYNCAKQYKDHPLHRHRRLYVSTTSISNSMLLNRTCLFRSTESKNVSTRPNRLLLYSLVAVVGGLTLLVVLIMAVLIGRRQILRQCGKFQLQQVVHSAKSQLADAPCDYKSSTVCIYHSNINLNYI